MLLTLGEEKKYPTQLLAQITAEKKPQINVLGPISHFFADSLAMKSIIREEVANINIFPCPAIKRRPLSPNRV